MKTIFNLLLFLSLLSFKPKDIVIQDSPIKIQAIFDGYIEEYGFSFSYTNEEGFEETLVFDEISDKLLKTHDLKSDEFTGSEYTLTYKTETSEDDNEVLTLLNIDLLE